ncbi:MAG TPA: hypothetical protein VGD67_17320, partial [Pseudonocardiaceae bacterium]
GGLHGGPAERPAWAAPVTRVCEPLGGFYAWADLLAARGLPSPPSTGLMVGGRRGYRAHLLPGTGDRVTAAAGVVEAVRAATGDGADGAAVAMYLDDTDVAAFRAAGVTAPPVLLTLDAELPLPADGWDGYLAGLSRGRRHAVRTDARRFAESGLTVEHRPATECATEVGRLMAATEARYGHYADPVGLAAAFARQAAAMADVATVLLCRDEDGVATGFCLYYVWGDSLFVRAAGFDYTAGRGVGEYFELVFRRPILDAHERGLRRVHLGIEAAGAKALRGARLHGLWMLDLAAHSALHGHDHAVATTNSTVVADLVATSPAIGRALGPDVAPLLPGGAEAW